MSLTPEMGVGAALGGKRVEKKKGLRPCSWVILTVREVGVMSTSSEENLQGRPVRREKNQGRLVSRKPNKEVGVGWGDQTGRGR